MGRGRITFLGGLLMLGLGGRAEARGVTVRRFDNGLTWIHRSVHHNAIAAVELFLAQGAAGEPADQAGLSELMCTVWPKGTPRRNALKIAQEMEAIGGAFGITAQDDFIALGGQVIADRWPAYSDLLQDILFNPVFPEDEIKKEQDAQVNALRTKHERLFNVAEEMMRRTLFGDHPYGRPDGGTEESVRGLDRATLDLWHKRVLNARGAVLVTVGPLSARSLRPWVESLVQSWPSNADAVPAIASVVYPRQLTVVEDRKKFEQGYVMRAHPAPAVTDADYPVVKTINALLGAGMSSPLFEVVREQAGLAYEVSSFYPSRRAGGALVIYAGTDPKNIDLAEEKINEVLLDFLDAPPSANDLRDAQNLIRGHYLMDHQTNARSAWYLGWWELLGKGHAYDRHYPDDVSRVTAADVHRVAHLIFDKPCVTVRVRSSLSH